MMEANETATSADSERGPLDPAREGLPFRPVTRAGELLFLSGQIGAPLGTTEVVAGGVGSETRQILENIGTLLADLDAALTDVVKCTVLLVEMSDYATMNEVYREFFPATPPARTAFAVAALPFGARVEIECIVCLPQ